MNTRAKLLIVLILALVIGGVVYFLPPRATETVSESTPARFKKVILLGIDGMDPKVARTMMSEGDLPNFDTLSETGTFLELQTSNPPHSPVAWASVATGTNPGKHNIFDFIRRDPGDMLPKLALSYQSAGLTGTSYHSYLKATPFWKMTSDAGILSSVIRFPLTFPPDQVTGRMFSGLGVPDVRGRLAGYTFFTSADVDGEGKDKTVKVSVKDGKIQTELAGPFERKDGKLSPITLPLTINLLPGENRAELEIAEQKISVPLDGWSDWVEVSFSTGMLGSVKAIFRAYLDSMDPFELYIGNLQMDPTDPTYPISYPHEYSAEFAKEFGLYHTLGLPEETEGYGDGKLPEEGFFDQAETIEKERGAMFWKEFDAFKAAPRGLLTFVFDTTDRVEHLFWDYKFLGSDPVFKVNEHIRDQYKIRDQIVGEVMAKMPPDTLLMVVSDHGFSSFERAFDLNRWLIENGYMTIKPSKADDEGALFRNVDWKKTRAYSLGFNSLYINRANREKNGSVEDADVEPLMAELISKLAAVTDSAHPDKTVIREVYRGDKAYNGPFVKDGPDLVVGFGPGYRMSWQNAVGGYSPEVIMDNLKRWKGDHLIDPTFVPGVFFSNQKLDITRASLVDIAPTIMDAFGLSESKEFDGHSLLGK